MPLAGAHARSTRDSSNPTSHDIKKGHAWILVQWIKKAGKRGPLVLGRYAGEDQYAMLGELMAATGWEWGDAKDFVFMIIMAAGATSGGKSRSTCRRGCMRYGGDQDRLSVRQGA
jgi:hypothetical protein